MATDQAEGRRHPTGYEYLFMALSGMLATDIGSIGSYLAATTTNNDLRSEIAVTARQALRKQTSMASIFELSARWLNKFIESEDLEKVGDAERIMLTGMLTETYATAKILLILMKSGMNQQKMAEVFEDFAKFEGAGGVIEPRAIAGQSIEMLPEYLSLLAKEFEKLYVK